ncbi:MAG: serine/threonine-protein kinase, partial [Cyanobacteriota bacterium]
NIILSPKGIIKLTDFGIAQLTDEQKKLTQTGSLLGSIMYIPPEQLENSADIDHRADIYSLGATLYQLLTGTFIFNGNTVSEIVFKILKEQPKIPSVFNSEIPHALDHIIIKSLMKNKEQRYQSALEMSQDLSLLLQPTNNISNTFMNTFDFTQTLRINSDNTNFSKTIIKKTNINQNYISNLSKNFSWIKEIFKNWKTENINNLNFNNLLVKLTEPSIFGKCFSGILVIDKNIYLFIYEGYFIGVIDLNSGLTGDNVFEKIDNNLSSFELKIPNDTNIFLIGIISGIIEQSGESIHNNFDSSLVNLSNIIENIYNEKEFTGYITCFSEKNIYYSGFYKGVELFCIPVNVETNSENNITLKDVLINQSVIFNTYAIKNNLLKINNLNILKDAIIEPKYLDDKKTKLYDIVNMEKEEVPIHLIKEAKQNSFLDLNLNRSDKINILEQEISIIDFIKKNPHYNFIDWLINEYFYLLNSTGNINTLKYLYSWIPATENIKFYQSLLGDDGNYYNFDLVFNGQVKGETYKKTLFLIRFGNGKIDDVNSFLEDSIKVKKKLIKSGDIGSVIYISTNEFENDSLKLFYERTVEPRKGFLGSLDKLTKYKGFVRIGVGRGFHFNLIEYNEINKSFNVIAPLLK